MGGCEVALRVSVHVVEPLLALIMSVKFLRKDMALSLWELAFGEN
jgi:hypothetical protein